MIKFPVFHQKYWLPVLTICAIIVTSNKRFFPLQQAFLALTTTQPASQSPPHNDQNIQHKARASLQIQTQPSTCQGPHSLTDKSLKGCIRIPSGRRALLSRAEVCGMAFRVQRNTLQPEHKCYSLPIHTEIRIYKNPSLVQWNPPKNLR